MSTPAMRRAQAELAAHTRWAQASSEDRKAQMAHVAKGLELRLIREVDPDGVLPPDELAVRVENARKAHMARMRLAKAQRAEARRKRAESERRG